MLKPAQTLMYSLVLLGGTVQASELRPLALNAQEILGVSNSPVEGPADPPATPSSSTSLAPLQAGFAQPTAPLPPQGPPRTSQALPAAEPARPVEPVIAAPTPQATPTPVASRLYEVRPGEMASEVFTRWLRDDGQQLIWETRRDFRLEAGARFNETSALDAIRAVAEVLGRTHPDFVVRAFSNGVVVVMDRN